MECPLSLLDGDSESLLEGVQTTVIWQLEIVDAGHDTGKIVVRCIRRLAGTAYHREDGCKTLKAYGEMH